MIYWSKKHRPPKIEILPHPQAPLFGGSDAPQVMQEVGQMVGGGRFSTANEEVRQAIRQAALVSLWFFLKFVAGYSGPYEQVNTDLHVDMCNFYQRARRPGGRAAAFLPRGTFKSTVLTHGANSWEILRDPGIVIGLCSSIIDRAQEFLQITQRTFDGNEMLAWLFPEFVKDLEDRGRVTADTFVVPNRPRFSVHPTIKVFAVGGSTQGIHVTYLKVDDPIGDAQLDANRNPNADMLRIENWLKSNTRTLLMDPRKGQVMVVGTRYAAGDAYTFIFDSVRSIWGFPNEEEVQVVEEGEWDVYYREVEEEGELLFPERIDHGFLKKMEKDDPWTLWTQYYNRTRKMGSSEFALYRLRECFVERGGLGEVKVSFIDGETQEWVEERLEDMDVVQAVDPAATEKKTDARTSRSVAVVYARDGKGRRFLLRVKAGYVKIQQVFEWVFEHMRLFPMIRLTAFEMQGAFKLLEPLLREEQMRRGVWVRAYPLASGTSDKESRIRVALEPVLGRGLVYAPKEVERVVWEEMRSFPGGRLKDVLDAWAIAEKVSVQPPEPLDEEEWEEEEYEKVAGRDPVTGY
jgi:hypothetical protein